MPVVRLSEALWGTVTKLSPLKTSAPPNRPSAGAANARAERSRVVVPGAVRNGRAARLVEAIRRDETGRPRARQEQASTSASTDVRALQGCYRPDRCSAAPPRSRSRRTRTHRAAPRRVIGHPQLHRRRRHRTLLSGRSIAEPGRVAVRAAPLTGSTPRRTSRRSYRRRASSRSAIPAAPEAERPRVMTKLTAPDVPPPGVGLNTVTAPSQRSRDRTW